MYSLVRASKLTLNIITPMGWASDWEKFEYPTHIIQGLILFEINLRLCDYMLAGVCMGQWGLIGRNPNIS